MMNAVSNSNAKVAEKYKREFFEFQTRQVSPQGRWYCQYVSESIESGNEDKVLKDFIVKIEKLEVDRMARNEDLSQFIYLGNSRFEYRFVRVQRFCEVLNVKL